MQRPIKPPAAALPTGSPAFLSRLPPYDAQPGVVRHIERVLLESEEGLADRR